jgi:hypothetical protein
MLARRRSVPLAFSFDDRARRRDGVTVTSRLTQTLIPRSQRLAAEAPDDGLNLSAGDSLSKRSGFLIMLTQPGVIEIADASTLSTRTLIEAMITVAGYVDPRQRVGHRHRASPARGDLDPVGAQRGRRGRNASGPWRHILASGINVAMC